MYKLGLGALLLCLALMVQAQSVVDTHMLNGDCETCHENGEPSINNEVENRACIECHGSVDTLDGPYHQSHSYLMMCSDCHKVHASTPVTDSCMRCHH